MTFLIKCSHLVSFILGSYTFHCFEEAQVYNCIFCHQPLPIKNCLNNAEIVPSTSAFLTISIHGNLFGHFLKSDYFSHIGCQILWAFCCLPLPFAMGQNFIQASRAILCNILILSPRVLASYIIGEGFCMIPLLYPILCSAFLWSSTLKI